MKNFILFIAIVCGGVCVMFYAAAKEAADGPNWASNLCSASRSLSLTRIHCNWLLRRSACQHSGS
jgi:hypothetical protein